MRSALLPLLFLVTLNGCSVLGPITADSPSGRPGSASVAEVLTLSRRLSAEGRWSESIDVIAKAQRRSPDNEQLVAQRLQLEERWQRIRRQIYDEIAAGDAEALRNRLTLLEALSVAQPDDIFLMARRIFAREELNARLPRLVECSEWHVETEPELARRCHAVALGIMSDDSTAQRLALVGERLADAGRQVEAGERRQRRQQAATDQRRRQQAATDQQRRARDLLADAKAAVDARDYRRALDTLDEVAELQPNNPEIAGLRKVAQAGISPQIEALVKLGDHLYLDEQLDAAIATWQAALTLNPDNADIVARIDRARTVLQRLDQLRRTQTEDTATTTPAS
jgi:tetratricopeptide (TPR) repeat protein